MDHSGHDMEHIETEDGIVMIMRGIPLWMFWLGITLIIGASFVTVERFSPTFKDGFRINLIKNKRVYRVVKHRWFQPTLQLGMMAIFAALIVFGLAGSRTGNITPIMVWTIWWALLVFAIAFAGPVFCMVCPWDGFANLVTRLGMGKRKKNPINLGFKLPKAMANLYPALILFVGLTWMELGWGVTTNPRQTSYMAVGMVGLAVGYGLVFTGEKAFCKTSCLVGRISGLYANFSPVEVRPRNPRTCGVCKTEDCLHGNEKGYPCPTGINLKTVKNSTYCTFCTECVKSCNYHNVAFNIRPFAKDLPKIANPRRDEAWLAITLLSLTAFHGLTMTPLWESFRPGEWSIVKALDLSLGLGRVGAFTVGMALAMAIPVALYWGTCWLSAKLARSEELTTGKAFTQFAYSLLPVALFYHMAHNAMHLLMEGGHLVPALSDPMGTGADIFGTADVQIGSLFSQGTVSVIQVSLIVVGHIIGIIVAHRISRRIIPEKRKAILSQIPMLLLMILFSIGSMTLVAMDMNMRVGRM